MCAASKARLTSSEPTFIYAVNGILVRRSVLASTIALSPRFLQIAAFIVCAAAQGLAFLRWRKKWREISDPKRRTGWQLHEGWFTGAACLGSIAGAIGYGARLGNLVGIYSSIKLETELGSTSTASAGSLMLIEQEYVLRHRYSAAFYVVYPYEVALTVWPPSLKL